MKPLQIGLLLLSLTLTAVAQNPAQLLLKEGQAAYTRGELENARAKFESVLRMDPKNQLATGYLKQIRARLSPGTSQQDKLAQVLIPNVSFREATLGSALDAIKQSVAKASNGTTSVNFVLQIPESVALTPVTMNVTNIPATEVLKYIGTLANVTFVYDTYAVIVRPASGTGESVQAQPSKGQ